MAWWQVLQVNDLWREWSKGSDRVRAVGQTESLICSCTTSGAGGALWQSRQLRPLVPPWWQLMQSVFVSTRWVTKALERWHCGHPTPACVVCPWGALWHVRHAIPT
jgi:hypothetical protein